jgi:signal transduction histidine kinase
MSEESEREEIKDETHQLQEELDEVEEEEEEEEVREAEWEEGATAIIRNAKRLQRLAEAILDATRIESNAFRIDKERLDLNNLILNALDDIIIKEEELKYGDSNDNKIRKLLYKACKEEIIIEGDRTRLIQVISNIIGNAIKFTKEGTISIAVEKKKDNKEVIVSVKDTGSGIDSEILPKLFTKFVTKSSKGTGLGLFISKSMIEAHGGKIWAENNADGKGAIFAFSLPID